MPDKQLRPEYNFTYKQMDDKTDGLPKWLGSFTHHQQ
jgi:hypothetical protein